MLAHIRILLGWLCEKKPKSMEGSRSITFTPNVDLQMVQIIDNGTLIYFLTEKVYIKCIKYMFF